MSKDINYKITFHEHYSYELESLVRYIYINIDDLAIFKYRVKEDASFHDALIEILTNDRPMIYAAHEKENY